MDQIPKHEVLPAGLNSVLCVHLICITYLYIKNLEKQISWTLRFYNFYKSDYE